jgi:hypothetical protein
MGNAAFLILPNLCSRKRKYHCFWLAKNEQENKEKITILNTKASFIKEKNKKWILIWDLGSAPIIIMQTHP